MLVRVADSSDNGNELLGCIIEEDFTVSVGDYLLFMTAAAPCSLLMRYVR